MNKPLADAIERMQGYVNKFGRRPMNPPAFVDDLRTILAAARAQAVPEDPGCVCKGNWRLILSEVQEQLGKEFFDKDGKKVTLFGLVHGDDDYYYGTWSKETGYRLLSCVGNLESWDLTPVDDASPINALPEGEPKP